MLYNVFLIMLASGVLLFIISIILLFAFKIPDLIDELSGRKARRQIKRLRELNSGTGALDGASTTDVYKAVSSGSLFSDNTASSSSLNTSQNLEEAVITGETLNETPTDVWKFTENEGIESEEDVPTENQEHNTDSIETSYIGEDVGTSDFDEESSTSFFSEEEQETGVLEEIEGYLMRKRCVIVIEEQSSLDLSL